MKTQSENQTEERKSLRSLKEAGISYSVSAVLPVALSVLLTVLAVIFWNEAGKGEPEPQWYIYLSYLFPQLAFATSAVIYFKRSKVSVRATYRGCKWYYFVIAFVMQFGLLFALNGLNGLFTGFLGKLGYQSPSSPIPALDGWKLLPALLVLAVLPAVCEETLMRGILTRQMNENGWGLAATVLISGALFSLFHHNPEQTLYQFVCGVCFALLAVRAGSILPAVLAHFCNNAVILILQSVFAPRYGAGWSLTDVLSKGGYIALTVVSAACLVAAVALLIFFGKKEEWKGGVKNGKIFFLGAATGLVVFAVEWIMYLAIGFGA